jgi:hypothetical protein
MNPKKETIEEFKKMYQEEFGEEISDTQAYEKFLGLVNLLRAILKVPTRKDPDHKSPGPSLFDDDFKNGKLKE